AAVVVLLELLGYEVRSPLDPAGKRRLLISLLRSALVDRCAAAPLVIAIEDLHWCDASSSEVITDLVANITSLRCLFISTSREPTDVRRNAELLALDALPPAAAAELVER